MSSGQLCGCSSSRTASDQHQPASSRAMARWRPRSVSCVHRSLPSGCADAGSRPAPARGRGRRRVPSSAQLAPRPIPGSVMPRGFDQQSAGMAVAGVGDPALGADGARGALGGHQPTVGANGPAGPAAQSPILVASRTRSTSRSRAGTAAGSLPGCWDRGGHLRDRGIQTVPGDPGRPAWCRTRPHRPVAGQAW